MVSISGRKDKRNGEKARDKNEEVTAAFVPYSLLFSINSRRVLQFRSVFRPSTNR